MAGLMGMLGGGGAGGGLGGMFNMTLGEMIAQFRQEGQGEQEDTYGLMDMFGSLKISDAMVAFKSNLYI